MVAGTIGPTTATIGANMDFPDDLYEFPADHVGRRTYVSIRGHSRSVPKFKTFRGSDGYRYILPEFGGTELGGGQAAPYYMPDKSPYLSPLDGSYVTSRSQHREHMKRHNVIEAGDQPVSRVQANRDAHRPITGQEIADAIRQLGGH